MKLITQWRFILLSALFSLLGMGSAWAQFREGGVYYFESAYLTGKSITTANATKLTSATTDKSDTKQLWVANEVSTGEGGFTLRNLANGQYLRSTNSNSGQSYWNTVATADANCQFSCTGPDGNDTYAMRATNTSHTQHFMHAPSADKVVGWEEGSVASRWLITEVNLYDADAVPEALDNLFEDAACTTLEKTFANIKDIDIDIDYLKLPETLRNMVKKVYSQTWTENNYDGTKSAWDSDYAQKYRVQLYEPYNDIMNASEALTINWHTNLNNPTGIFANNGDVLYVMVDGEIEEGASLYLDYFVDGDRLSTDLNHGTPLQRGLNIITCTADKSNYCINYVVEVFDTTDGKRGHKAKKRALTGYSPLKIHIEGGYLNGYWNKMGDALYPADKNDNWEYLEARANQKELLVLGQYVTLQFPLKDADTKGNTGLGSYLNDQVLVEDVIREWDNIMKWERMLLGLLHEDVSNAAAPKSPYSERDHVIEYIGNDSDFPSGYGDYYNIHGLAWGVDHNTMYATGDYSAYHYATMDGVIKSIPTDAGSHWGPAHEMGHQHQNLINMRGEMEGSNNLFSNVVLWVHGELTSRVNGTEGSLEAVLKNFNNESGHYLSNSIWGISQMYYKLFLYYHVLGHNPKFYPRLFEMLRQDPQRDNNAGVVDGANAQLHLYKKVCEAAGEDLTEFFRAHGFFKPLNNAFVDDSYNVSVFNMSQKQIDAAIAEVKEQAKTKGWKVNTAVLFINDATGENILSHKDGVEHLTLNPETTICAQVGNYSNFNNTTANYSYSLSGTTVTMNGTGG
ncbi:MAG: M60 family metallopeptidase, partial [Prevotellamassilia sp.]|nr:M60 family metallopeptidase [Prevotellamassilia sp.]